jgi:hypothetical protein
MYLVAGFFDESTDEDSGGLSYTVAGFVGNQLVTSTLELRWRDVLLKYELDYFKASELSAGTGQFQKFRDDPKEFNWRPFSKRENELFKQIKTDFTDVIINCGNGLYGIGAVVILPDLERIRAEYENAKALPVPYYLCSTMCMVEAGLEMAEQNAGHKTDLCWLRPIFDTQEEYSGRAKTHWDIFCEKNPLAAKYLLPPHYEKEQDYLMLQAADYFAFEARKLVFTQRHNKPIRVPMKRLIATGNKMKIYRFDYVGLKMAADAQYGIYPDGLRERLAGQTVEGSLTAMREVIEDGTEE